MGAIAVESGPLNGGCTFGGPVKIHLFAPVTDEKVAISESGWEADNQGSHLSDRSWCVHMAREES